MAAFAFGGHKLAGELPVARKLPDSPLELRAFHHLSVGKICPSVNLAGGTFRERFREKPAREWWSDGALSRSLRKRGRNARPANLASDVRPAKWLRRLVGKP